MIVVCGDSFNFDDPDYPNIHWTSKLSNLVNLSLPGASNLVIRMQIDRAILLNPDLIVVSFTSCLRHVLKYDSVNLQSNLLDRIYSPKSLIPTNLISFPFAGARHYNKLSDNQLNILRQFVAEFVDLDVYRQESYYLIKDSLETLSQSNIKFSYSLGGFDHKTFCNQSPFDFSNFKRYETPINLWDYCAKQKEVRPWYHVVDQEVHQQLAEYYSCLIKS